MFLPLLVFLWHHLFIFFSHAYYLPSIFILNLFPYTHVYIHSFSAFYLPFFTTYTRSSFILHFFFYDTLYRVSPSRTSVKLVFTCSYSLPSRPCTGSSSHFHVAVYLRHTVYLVTSWERQSTISQRHDAGSANYHLHRFRHTVPPFSIPFCWLFLFICCLCSPSSSSSPFLIDFSPRHFCFILFFSPSFSFIVSSYVSFFFFQCFTLLIILFPISYFLLGLPFSTLHCCSSVHTYFYRFRGLFLYIPRLLLSLTFTF